MPFQAPLVRELTRSAIEVVLRRNGVGRIAYVLDERVEVEPIHFAFADGWIYGRTAQGARLRTVRHDRAVTFHVDEIDDVLVWRSIVAHGPVTMLPLDPTPQERAQWTEGLAALQRLESPGRRAADDVGTRGTAFRIALDEVRGQRCGDAPPTTPAWDAAADVAADVPAEPWPTNPRAPMGQRRDVLDTAHP